MTNLIRMPGVVDVHVHLREPGGEHKETFATGTAAALAGGVTTVLAMPNTDPPITDGTTLTLAEKRATGGARCDYGLFLGATDDNTDIPAEVQRRTAGLKIYVNETFGPLRVESLAVIHAHLRNWRGPGPVAVHAEELMVPALAMLATITNTPVHFCHISRTSEITAIRAAKEHGAPITCEVTPHHLWLTEDDVSRLGPLGMMRPPLATAGDREALWANLDIVDCIATDHAPHTLAEKRIDSPPPGVPGLETTLPLLLTAVHEGRLSRDRLIGLTSTRPRDIFNLPAQSDTYVEVDLDAAWELPDAGWQTKVDWSPFAGMPVRGRVVRTVLRDEVVYDDGKLLAQQGFGRNVRQGDRVTRRQGE